MSFANSSVQNTYRPDTRVLNVITALSARVTTLEEDKTTLQARASASEAANAKLTALVSSLLGWALMLTDGSRGASG